VSVGSPTASTSPAASAAIAARVEALPGAHIALTTAGAMRARTVGSPVARAVSSAAPLPRSTLRLIGVHEAVGDQASSRARVARSSSVVRASAASAIASCCGAALPNR
jgi:hypothetical protein